MLAAALAVESAHADPVQARAPAPERELQRIESRLLGPAHAAEHAALRRAPAVPSSQGLAPRHVAARTATEAPASEVGEWDAAGERPIIRGGDPARSMPAIHAVMLPTGKVLWFGPRLEDGRRFNTEAWAVQWDPVTHELADVPPPDDPRTGRPTGIYCGGASLLPDGRVLVTGGWLHPPDDPGTSEVPFRGLDQVWTYDPFSQAWERHGNLSRGRWYPTQLLTADGRTVILQGLDETGGDYNRGIDIFDPSRPQGQEITRLDRALTDAETGDLYPHLFWMPTGRALVAGPHEANSYFLEVLPDLTATLTQAADPLRRRAWGNGVLLHLGHDSRTGVVWQLGGAGAKDAGGPMEPATPSTEVFDEVQPDAWAHGPPMQVARAHQNTVLLPDGSMVIVGGGTGEVPRMWATTDAHHQVELYDAQAGRWRLGPVQRGDRAYHSTAVLLPDGSVVSAGDDDLDDGDIDTYEVYRPPYFFRGPRPIITAAPRTVAYGATMPVATPNTDIVRAVLMAPGATTHAVDMSQRAISMPVARRADGTGYDVATPLDANIALPGHHMLFLVDSAGRPSVASWVRLDPDAAEAAPPTPVPADGPAGARPDPGRQPRNGGTAAPTLQGGEGDRARGGDAPSL